MCQGCRNAVPARGCIQTTHGTLARPETRVVMLTSFPDEEAVLSAIIAGASGYLLKQIRGRDLVSALEAVGRGESLLDSANGGLVYERWLCDRLGNF